jgi:hypothetical protein
VYIAVREKKAEITGYYNQEILEIENKLKQLENGRFYENSKSHIDGSLNENINYLRIKINELLNKIECGQNSISDSLRDNLESISSDNYSSINSYQIHTFNWDDIKSKIFNVDHIENRVNADKLFVSLLLEIEKRNININKVFTIAEIVELIPKGTAGINNYATYGFSIMSMFSSQKERDYFIFENSNTKSEITAITNNNTNRDNYYWKKYYMNERFKINQKYIISN